MLNRQMALITDLSSSLVFPEHELSGVGAKPNNISFLTRHYPDKLTV
jgi:hypothetical protein